MVFNEKQERMIREIAFKAIAESVKWQAQSEGQLELYLSLPKYSENLKCPHCRSDQVGVVEHGKYEWEFGPDYGRYEERVIKRACKQCLLEVRHERPLTDNDDEIRKLEHESSVGYAAREVSMTSFLREQEGKK